MIVDRGCYDRGCACVDPRIDKDTVDIKERAGIDGAIQQLSDRLRLIEAEIKHMKGDSK